MSVEPPNPFSPPASPPARRRTFWQRRVRDPIAAQLTQGATPEKIALTLAMGVACGLFPFLGLTTLLCFAVAALLRLNQPIIHIVNQLLWPVHLTAMVAYVRVGERLYGSQPLPYDTDEIARLFMHSQREFWQRFGLVSCLALIVWLISAPIMIVAIFYPLRHILRKLPGRSKAAQTGDLSSIR